MSEKRGKLEEILHRARKTNDGSLMALQKLGLSIDNICSSITESISLINAAKGPEQYIHRKQYWMLNPR